MLWRLIRLLRVNVAAVWVWHNVLWPLLLSQFWQPCWYITVGAAHHALCCVAVAAFLQLYERTAQLHHIDLVMLSCSCSCFSGEHDEFNAARLLARMRPEVLIPCWLQCRRLLLCHKHNALPHLAANHTCLHCIAGTQHCTEPGHSQLCSFTPTSRSLVVLYSA
jgi:hypothetical protein